MKFEFRQFKELTLEELHDILKLRINVFVVEQNCPYPELDDLDKNAIHQFVKENGEIVAYARLLKPGNRFSEYSIGRVVVSKTIRQTGIGIQLMNTAIDFILNNFGATSIKISAQKHLQNFYENLGFRVVTKEYLEDGIPHLGMRLKKARRTNPTIVD